MLVGRGALSFRSYEVSGKGSAPNADKITERLEQFQFSAESGGAEEGAQVGWVGPDHLFDGDFSSAKVTRGRYTVFALRVDTRKVPGPLLAAHVAVECEAAKEAEGLERLSGSRRREIKQEIKRRLLKEMPPSQRAYGVFWNVSGRRLHVQTTSKTVHEHLRGLFEKSFELDLSPLSPGLVAANYAKSNGLLPAIKDARRLQLGPEPVGAGA